MITLKGPKLSPKQSKELAPHKAKLESALAEIEGEFQKVTELEKKKAQLRKQTPALQRAAAAIEDGAELKLLANQKAIQRIDEAIQQAEGEAYDWKLPLFNTIDQAQEVVSRIGQATHEELLDKIGAAFAPFYRNFDEARFVGKSTPAVSDLVVSLLVHRTNAGDSIERLIETAKDMLRKVNALLDGSEVWSYGNND